MKGQGARVTTYDGDPFDLSDTIAEVVKQDTGNMTIRQWVVIVLTAAERPMSTRQIMRVIAKHRTGSPTKPSNSSPPTIQNVNNALTVLRDSGAVEFAGLLEGTDMLGRTYKASSHQIASEV